MVTYVQIIRSKKGEEKEQEKVKKDKKKQGEE